MTTQFDVAIDWRRKGVLCWDARPSDALNLLPSPITYSTLGLGKAILMKSMMNFLRQNPTRLNRIGTNHIQQNTFHTD